MTSSASSDRSPIDTVRELRCWSGPVEPVPLVGGLTNASFVVSEGGDSFVVRVGDDLPVHGIQRSFEVATAVAAHKCGLSPEITHHEPGALVMRYIDARTLTADDIGDPATVGRLVDVIGRCHREMPTHLSGPTLMFWVFQVCRNYLRTTAAGTCRLADRLDDLVTVNTALEHAVGPIRPVFCHNDLLPGNFLDDGDSIWLIDWEYAGWNSALFDLANLASNAEMAREQQHTLLMTYHRREPDERTTAAFQAMMCASLLRESLWGLVQEQHSDLDFDFAEYTDTNLARFDAALARTSLR